MTDADRMAEVGRQEQRSQACPKCGDEKQNLPVHLRKCDGETE